MAGMLSSLHLTLSNDVLQKVKHLLADDNKPPPKSPAAGAAADTQHVFRCSLTSIHEDGVLHDVTRASSTAQLDDEPPTLFHRSHKGLFLGVVVLTGTILVIVIFYVNNDHDAFIGALLYHATSLVLTSLLMVATVSAALSLRQLGRSRDGVNLIDDLLLLFSMSGFLLLHLFILVSGVDFLASAHRHSASGAASQAARVVALLEVAATALETVQCVGQVLFVIDGLQRYAVTPLQQQVMPGRGWVGFLIIVNVCLWVFKSLVIKEVLLARHLRFYGSTAWPIILSLCLPLQLFYYFHCSVCLADVWSQAYRSRPHALVETNRVMT